MGLIHLDDRDGVRPLPNVDSPDQAAASALGAVESRCQWEPGDLSPFDTVLVSMTKYQHRDREPSWMSAVRYCKGLGKRTWIFQEAEADWFNHRPDEEQLAFVENCRHADGMLCHTRDSAEFYKTLLGIPCVAVPTLMPLSRLPGPLSVPREPKYALVLGTPDERARGWFALAYYKHLDLDLELKVYTRDGADGGARVQPVLQALGLQGEAYGYLPLQRYADLFRGAAIVISGLRARAAMRDQILANWYRVPMVSCWTADVGEFPFLVPSEAPMWWDVSHHNWDPIKSPELYQKILKDGGLL